jgi:hypothetical protein
VAKELKEWVEALRRRNEPYEFNALAIYNSERARGIVHTPEWDEKMRLEQERFAEQYWARAERDGWLVVEDGRFAVKMPKA